MTPIRPVPSNRKRYFVNLEQRALHAALLGIVAAAIGLTLPSRSRAQEAAGAPPVAASPPAVPSLPPPAPPAAAEPTPATEPAAPAAPDQQPPTSPPSQPAEVPAVPEESASQGRVQGQVIDAATGRPLREVYVGVEGMEYQTATDERGEFSLALPAGRYKIQFAFDLYNVQAFEIEMKERQNFRFDKPIRMQLEAQGKVEKTIIREPARNSTEAANLQRQESAAALADRTAAKEKLKIGDIDRSRRGATKTRNDVCRRQRSSL